MPKTIAAALFAATMSQVCAAQVVPGNFGYEVQGQLGTNGTFCWYFDCVPRPLTVISGETLTLRVNAPLGNFFAIGASFSATSCLPIPGIQNNLILDPQVVTIAIGAVTQSSPILACWGGHETVALTLPAGLPSGLQFTTQAVAAVPNLTSANGVSFSVAVQKTVQ